MNGPVHRITLHVLDRAALADFRASLREAASVPGTRIIVDLCDCEQPHQRTVVALLAVAARRGRARGTEVVVRRAPPSMVAVLHAVGLDDRFDVVPAVEAP